MISKGYKHTKLGILPIDWEVVRLGDIAEIKKDKFNPQKNKKVPCVELEHISQNLGMLLGFIDSSNQLSIKNAFSKGDVLFGKLRPYLRKFWKATFDGVCSSEIWVLQGKKALNDFLFYLVQTDRFSQIANATCGTKMPRADWGLMKDEMFSIPPLAEQEKIAEILSTWDTQIQNFESLITEKQNLKKGLCQTLLTPKTRLKGFSEDWQVVGVGEIFKITRGNVLATDKLSDFPSSESCYPVFSSKTKDGGLLGFYNEYLFEDCITWTTDGANAGDVNFRKGKFYCTNVCGVLINDMGYCNQCVAEILNTRTRQYVSYVGNPKLMNNVMKEIEIKIPSNIAEQEKIAEILSEADNEITLLEQKLESLKSQKKGLMQKLLNGKMRVRVCQ